MKRYFIAAVAVLIFIGCLCACEQEPLAEKLFEGDGYSITLDESFSSETADGFTAAYVSKAVCVYFSCDGSKIYGKNAKDFSHYQKLLAELSGAQREVIEYDDGSCCVITEEEVEGIVFKKASFPYEGKGGFWRVEFVCEEAVFDSLFPSIEKWGKSVKFEKGE